MWWWGKEGGRIIASFSELIGWESMEGNQETADKRWQQWFLEWGTHWHNDSQTFLRNTHTNKFKAYEGETEHTKSHKYREKENIKHMH